MNQIIHSFFDPTEINSLLVLLAGQRWTPLWLLRTNLSNCGLRSFQTSPLPKNKGSLNHGGWFQVLVLTTTWGVLTSVCRSERTGAMAVIWFWRVLACSKACLRSPRPGQEKTRGRLDVFLWSSASWASAWPRLASKESKRSRTGCKSLTGNRW